MDSLFLNKSSKTFERVDPIEEKGSSSTVMELDSDTKITQSDTKEKTDKEYDVTQGCVSEKVTSYLQELYKWNVGKGEGLPNNEVKVGERQTAKEVIDQKEELKEIVNPEAEENV